MNSRIEIDLLDIEPDTLQDVVRAVRAALDASDTNRWTLALMDLTADHEDIWDPQDISDSFLTESDDVIIGRLADGFFTAKEQA